MGLPRKQRGITTVPDETGRANVIKSTSLQWRFALCIVLESSGYQKQSKCHFGVDTCYSGIYIRERYKPSYLRFQLSGFLSGLSHP